MSNMPLLVRILICFLLGSIPFAVLAMSGTGINVLHAGSGNPGFNNVLRFSRSRAIITLIGDLGKGFLAVWLFYNPGEPIVMGWLYAFAAILGHCYSPFLKFHGGKGVATSAGTMLVLYPALTMICLLLFAILRVTGSRLRWREAGAIASLTSWVFFALLVLLFREGQHAVYASLLALFVMWRHRNNIRILSTAGIGLPRTEL